MGETLLAMKFEPHFDRVTEARLAVEAICNKQYPHPAAGPLIDELLMAVTEAMNNAVEHSGAKEVEIELRADERGLIFRVTTAGIPFEPPTGVAFPDLDGPDGLPEGGFGLAIISEMTDSVEYEHRDGYNIITLTKYIS
jgi:anti-sigma regulatory factor (Ser/Thr protein kinase)